MGTRARQAIRKNGAALIKQDQLPERTAPASKRPVRVKLRRVNCDYHVPYAPESIKRDWGARLKKALGTTSPDFVAATLRQIEIASRLPYQGTSEVAVNAALAIIEGAQPRNEIEAIAAIQLACAHAATMQVLNSLRNTTGVLEGFRANELANVYGLTICLGIDGEQASPGALDLVSTPPGKQASHTWVTLLSLSTSIVARGSNRFRSSAFTPTRRLGCRGNSRKHRGRGLQNIAETTSIQSRLPCT